MDNRFSTGKRYITSGVEERLPLYLIMAIWSFIDRERERTALDYLQIFRLESKNGIQFATHEQEQPEPFVHKYMLDKAGLPTVSEKVYVIDDGEQETMLLASEY